MKPRIPIAERFNEDIERFDGYVYTNSERLSCRLANLRISRAIVEAVDLAGKRVVDLGCGDGTYTMELVAAGAQSVCGIDAAEAAVERARERAANRPEVRFEAADIGDLEPPAERYDVAVLRGILHHLDDPAKAARIVCRMAREIVVVEPNGYSPFLKVIEKVSPYHVAHAERSFSPRRLDRWFEEAGGRVVRSTYVGVVPMLCPDFVAAFCKRVEPLIEGNFILRRLGCAQYIQTIRVLDR